MFIKQIRMQDGILNGIDQNLVNLQSINTINIMIGIQIRGINLIKEKKVILRMAKLESFL